MDLSPRDQIVQLIERNQKILLCTHRKPDGDAIGSIMGLAKALKLMGKEVITACADTLPEAFEFLPASSELTQNIHGQKDFVITLDCENTEVDRLKYHLEDNKIHIVVTPKKGGFSPSMVSTSQQEDSFDLIITVDVADIPQLGQLYDDNKELFQSTPMVNIDHHISNTEFGKVNWIDPSASSTAEMLFDLIRGLEKSSHKTLLVPETATFLLSGVTTDTGSFQNANTTPKAMEVAAELMEAGANQHDVVKYLFRTKKFSTLKLWGNILSKIEVDPLHRMVWSSISQQDLQSSGAHMDEAGDIIDELLVHAPEAEVVVLFKEDADMVSASFRSKTPQLNVMEVAQQFGGGGHVQAAGAKFKGQSMSEVQQKILTQLRSLQKKRLGIPEAEISVDSQQSDTPITQVLEGYTPVPTPGPSLEEKVQQSEPKTLVPAPEKAPQPAEVSGTDIPMAAQPSFSPEKPAEEKSEDIHQKTKAAIDAEQSFSSDTSFRPSQARQEKAHPQQAPRFTEPVPDYMKPPVQSSDAPAPETTPEQPTKPEVAPPAAEKKAETPAPQKPTPEDNEPVVRTVPREERAPEQRTEAPQTTTPKTPAPSDDDGIVVKQMTPPPAAPSAEDSQQGGDDDLLGGASAAPQAPTPPKDPFSTGDDGLTDIERALGGL